MVTAPPRRAPPQLAEDVLPVQPHGILAEVDLPGDHLVGSAMTSDARLTRAA